MEMTDKQIHLMAQLSGDRGLYAECKGADLDALQELGLLEWFDARSSTTPFKEDPCPLFRIDYAWIGPVENWRELVGPEVSARVYAIDEIERAANSGPLLDSRAVNSRQTKAGGSRDERNKWRAMDVAAGQQICDHARPV